jgi:drug/metabolite transporter (DMT)-like permease
VSGRDAAGPNIRYGVGMAFFGSLMSACFLIPWKLAAEYGEPKLAVLVMLTVAAALNSMTAAFEARRAGAAARAGAWPATLSVAAAFAVLTLLGNWTSAEAVARISGALLAVVQRCEVIVVALLGAVVLGEPVRPAFWLGTGLAAVGLWILQRPGADMEGFDPVGALYGLGSAVCFGAMVVLARRYITRVQPFLLNALRLWMSVGLWFVVERRVPTARELSPSLLLYAGLAGFFGPFLSRLGALLSARHVQAHVTAVASLATPVLTLGLAYLVLHSLPTGRELLGGTIMLIGVAVPVAALMRR